MSQRPVLGIDLGTTYTCVASLDENQRVTVLANQEGDLTTPSVVYYEDSDQVTVGKFAKNELKRAQDRVVSLIKRHMGEEGYTVTVDGVELYPQAVSAVILRQVVEDALATLSVEVPAEGPLADVVITVPAYFGAAERQATRDAGEMAGLNVVNIINEPTAAAIAYGLLSGGGERTVLVYDLGGGTFDVTIIRVSAEEIRVVATGGDDRLGGADWDSRLVDLLVEGFHAEHPAADDPRTDEYAAGAIELLAEECKKALSRKNSYVDTITAGGVRAKVTVTREEYERATADLVGRTLDFTRDVVDQAKAKGVTAIDEVLLVGGMSHSPAVKRRLAEELPELPEGKLADPDQIVAKGAALFAATAVRESGGDPGKAVHALPGGKPIPTIVDVTSKGYGVAVYSGDDELVPAWLIKPNDEIPTTVHEVFQTRYADQREVDIQVYESRTDLLTDVLADHIELVSGRLVDLPPKRPAGEPVQVAFELGSDAILRITARGSNGVEVKLEAKISGLVPDEVKKAPLPALVR